MESTRIGWIGLGTMGNPMSAQLLKAGYPLTVYNRSRDKEVALKEQGAAIAATPAQLVQQTDVIIIMVTDDNAIEQIFNGADGLLAADINGKIIVNMSTVSSAISKQMAAACADKGAHYLDAPVSGSVKQAETAQLVIMAGGDATAFEKVKPILETMGKKATHLGDTGAGNAAKLAINTLLAIHAQGLAEAIILAGKNGIDAATLMALLNDGAMANPFMKIKGEAIIADNYAPAFTVNNIAKDLGLAADIGLSTPLGRAALQTYNNAKATVGDEDLIAVKKHLED
ncbi:NAD(P)-dependent oxidoreductase [Mucilaginibacter pallidiroseus]|uniref:NAD(P)-dependent oxidoreductase n=1 Tax=Mucilaginibacter pallidiroseus TaxID=2599295 RepID=A0A563U541_9SPHI|nr:NAD(P)-dependent oxidoreductase [Mucilaginibacter pallidiroseus]TWR26461.1 NAD(P)-dependent oxidoreductase [Mucilaginibacter pallidiroseus]